MERKYIDHVILSRELSPGSYLRTLPAVRWLREHRALPFPADVTFLMGENGTGKSTLLEAIAVAAGFNAEGGSKNFSFSTRSTHSELCDCLTVSRQSYPRDGFFLRAESFYNLATNIDELDEAGGLGGPLINSYGGISLHKQSHGESFLSLVENRFGGQGLYLLDEPEAALSPARLLTLMVHIRDLVEKNSQFIIATHSPILMAFPGAHIYQLSEHGVESVGYRETEHYQLTKAFLDNPDKMLGYLFEDT